MSSCDRIAIEIGTTKLLKLRDLHRNQDGSLVDDADVSSVSARVLDADDNPVAGIPDPIVFTANASYASAWDGSIPGSGVSWAVEDTGEIVLTVLLTDSTATTEYWDYVVVKG